MLGKIAVVVACMVGSSAADTRDPWLREIVDYGRADGMIGLSLVNGVPSIVVGFPRDLAMVRLERGAKSWTSDAIYDGRRADLIVRDHTGALRLVLGSDNGRGLLEGGKVDVIGLANTDGFDVAFDKNGGAFACAVEGSNLASYVKLAERGARPGGWKITEVSSKPARQCAAAVAADGSVVIATANSAEAWVYLRRNGTWTSEKLSSEPGGGLSPMIAAGRAPDGSVGVAFVDGRGIQLARLTKDGWTRSVLAKDTGGVPEALALSFGETSRAHVAYMTWVPVSNGNTRGAIGYAVDGTVSKIEDATANRISLVVDTAGLPHLAYVHGGNGVKPDVVVYIRARKPDDAAGAWISDTDAFVPACAEQLAVDLGRFEDPDAARRGRAERLCRAWDHATPTLATIEARCTTGDAGACLVGGSLTADKQQAFERHELLDRPCGKGKRCATTYHEQIEIAFGAAGERDVKRSRAMYERACELGIGVACLLADQAVKACSPVLPIACSVALGRASELDAATKKLMRDKLAMACATKRPEGEPHPEACNALAYMEDAGDGGPKNAASARTHHVQACLAGAALSCTKLVGGAKPRGLAAEAFGELMEKRCANHGEEVCLALATAYQTGWVVKRDRAAATRVLVFACDELGSAEACRRAGKKPPAKAD